MRRWNRKLHNYLGLYLLFFLWLFALSGLLLNEPEWSFAQFWSQREEISVQRPIDAPVVSGDLAMAREVMGQLQIEGEIESITRVPDEERMTFRVVRPGKILSIDADLERGLATMDQIQVNGWGVVNMLHSFSGVSMNDPERERDWFLTRLWSLAMDALSLGMIILVASGVYMWLRSARRRWAGSAALILGCVGCGIFVFGIVRLL